MTFPKTQSKRVLIILLCILLLALFFLLYQRDRRSHSQFREVLQVYYTYESEGYDRINDLYAQNGPSAEELQKIRLLFTEEGWQDYSTDGRTSLAQYWMLVQESKGRTAVDQIQWGEEERTTSSLGATFAKIPWTAEVAISYGRSYQTYTCQGAFFLNSEGKINHIDFYTDEGLWEDLVAFCRENR